MVLTAVNVEGAVEQGRERCDTVELMKTVPLHLTPISELGLRKHQG